MHSTLLRTFTRLSTNKREEYFSQATLPGRTNAVPAKGVCCRHLPVASLCTPDECRRQASPDTGERQEAEYMLVCAAYELRDPKSIDLLRAFLDEYPDTPHANRIYALIASSYFFEGNYDDALAMFNSARLDLLGTEERDDMTYRLATCYLKTGNVKEAAIWFETLRSTSRKYSADCAYYISYIRYTQGRYDEALSGFLPLQDNAKYKNLVPYYIAEIYLLKKQYDKAEIVAQNALSAHPDGLSYTHTAELNRILGTAEYHFGKYHEAIKSFEQYLEHNAESATHRRDALYMLGMSYYQCGVYSQVPAILGEVTTENDALSQNAYLHMGLAYLQLADKTKARMAFEQAAASNADPKIKEQAAYNYALCIHETSYSAFGESVTVFEKFLNEFPNSPYAEKVSNYLVEVYMNTRSYDAALKSIDRISHPSKAILEAKQKILFNSGPSLLPTRSSSKPSVTSTKASRWDNTTSRPRQTPSTGSASLITA